MNVGKSSNAITYHDRAAGYRAKATGYVRLQRNSRAIYYLVPANKAGVGINGETQGWLDKEWML